MGRRIRIALYILSIIIVLGALLIVTRRGTGTEAVLGDAGTGTEAALEDAGTGTKAALGDAGTEAEEREIGAVEKNEAEGIATEVQESMEPVTLLFTGDVLFAKAFQAGYDAGGITGVLDEALLEELNAADVLMINNEFPFSDRGMPMEDKQYTFCCSPSYVGALNERGVDVVSLANNHTLD